jgi:hypothetical protein
MELPWFARNRSPVAPLMFSLQNGSVLSATENAREEKSA